MANSVVSSGSGEATGGLTDNEKMLSAVGYVWLCCALPLFLVPMFGAKDSRYAQFHSRQAAALYIIAVGGIIISYVFGIVLGIIQAMTGIPFLGCIAWVLQILIMGGCFIFMVMGAINAMQAQQKELPGIGALAAKLPF
jgi:hypothetical protein